MPTEHWYGYHDGLCDSRGRSAGAPFFPPLFEMGKLEMELILNHKRCREPGIRSAHGLQTGPEPANLGCWTTAGVAASGNSPSWGPLGLQRRTGVSLSSHTDSSVKAERPRMKTSQGRQRMLAASHGRSHRNPSPTWGERGANGEGLADQICGFFKSFWKTHHGARGG